MKKVLFLIPVAAGLIVAGCSTPAKYVDPASSRVITTVGQINIQDFANAADSMVASLIENQINPGKLRSGVPDEPALLAISRIKNETGTQFDTDLLIKKMRVALLKTGKIQTTTTMGLGGPEDPLASDPKAAIRLPDYTLSGKIIQDETASGNLRQSAFVFQLSLSSRAGIGIWEEEKTIVKQGSRPSVGF